MSDHTFGAGPDPDDLVPDELPAPIAEVPIEAPEADVVDQWHEVPLDEDDR